MKIWKVMAELKSNKQNTMNTALVLQSKEKKR
jgi:hypothetical protein